MEGSNHLASSSVAVSTPSPLKYASIGSAGDRATTATTAAMTARIECSADGCTANRAVNRRARCFRSASVALNTPSSSRSVAAELHERHAATAARAICMTLSPKQFSSSPSFASASAGQHAANGVAPWSRQVVITAFVFTSVTTTSPSCRKRCAPSRTCSHRPCLSTLWISFTLMSRCSRRLRKCRVLS